MLAQSGNEYFTAMFAGNLPIQDVVELLDVKVEWMTWFIRWIYGLRLPDSHCEIDGYNMKDLVDLFFFGQRFRWDQICESIKLKIWGKKPESFSDEDYQAFVEYGEDVSTVPLEQLRWKLHIAESSHDWILQHLFDMTEQDTLITLKILYGSRNNDITTPGLYRKILCCSRIMENNENDQAKKLSLQIFAEVFLLRDLYDFSHKEILEYQQEGLLHPDTAYKIGVFLMLVIVFREQDIGVQMSIIESHPLKLEFEVCVGHMNDHRSTRKSFNYSGILGKITREYGVYKNFKSPENLIAMTWKEFKEEYKKMTEAGSTERKEPLLMYAII